MRIIVVTPSVRSEMLEIVQKCLKRQTFPADDYEWLVGSPKDYGYGIWVKDPKKKEGDYYSLNASWNAMFKEARNAELIVSIVDGLWFQPDLLSKLYSHYLSNPKAIVGAVGNQYDRLINGKPEHMVWRDPRIRTDQGSFYRTLPTEVEWCVASIPKKAIFAIGGMDEEYDRGAALSEKEANLRMEKAGYELYLDQSIEYRAIKHDRLSSEWEEKYKIAVALYQKHVPLVLNGSRGYLDYLAG